MTRIRILQLFFTRDPTRGVVLRGSVGLARRLLFRVCYTIVYMLKV
jgi:hypothetical protein